MNLPSLLLLGFVAGATIIIGLPVGRVKSFSPTLRSALSMLAAGILIFLLVEILGDAMGDTTAALRESASRLEGTALAVLLVAGLLVGLLGLIVFEQRAMRGGKELSPQRLSLMIAVGIGFHNLSEGLAIGQSYSQGKIGLAVTLIVGFALHNATEGFGIVGPMVRGGTIPSWRSIFLLAAIGGGPTFVGTVLGSAWTSSYLSVASLGLASGALVYVIKELLAHVRKEARQVGIMASLVLGFVVGWGTDVAASWGSAESEGEEVQLPSAAVQPKLTSAAVAHEDGIADDILHERALQPQILADGTRRYSLTASVFPWQLYPGMRVDAWGYNDQVPGPLLRFTVGDRVEIVVKNDLPQPTTVHWHGLAVPNDMDGVPDATQPPIPPGGVFTYRFDVTPQMIGTHLYHTHVNDIFQMDGGLHGVIIVDPKGWRPPEVDALYEIGSFKVGNSEEENAFVLDGKAFPEAPALTVPLGAHVRLRMVNASAEESHVMHLHGYTFSVVALDGNPTSNPTEANTVMLGPGQTADVDFTATEPGRWMFHCHILDHLVNPGEGEGSASHMAGMGGLVTFVDVVPPGAAMHHGGYVAAGDLMSMK